MGIVYLNSFVYNISPSETAPWRGEWLTGLKGVINTDVILFCLIAVCFLLQISKIIEWIIRLHNVRR